MTKLNKLITKIKLVLLCALFSGVFTGCADYINNKFGFTEPLAVNTPDNPNYKVNLKFEGNPADWCYWSNVDFNLYMTEVSNLNALTDYLTCTVSGIVDSKITKLVGSIKDENWKTVGEGLLAKTVSGEFSTTGTIILYENLDLKKKYTLQLFYQTEYNSTRCDIKDAKINIFKQPNNAFHFQKNYWTQNFNTDYNYSHSLNFSQFTTGPEVIYAGTYFNLSLSFTSPVELQSLNIYSNYNDVVFDQSLGKVHVGENTINCSLRMLQNVPRLESGFEFNYGAWDYDGVIDFRDVKINECSLTTNKKYSSTRFVEKSQYNEGNFSVVYIDANSKYEETVTLEGGNEYILLKYDQSNGYDNVSRYGEVINAVVYVNKQDYNYFPGEIITVNETSDYKIVIENKSNTDGYAAFCIKPDELAFFPYGEPEVTGYSTQIDLSSYFIGDVNAITNDLYCSFSGKIDGEIKMLSGRLYDASNDNWREVGFGLLAEQITGDFDTSGHISLYENLEKDKHYVLDLYYDAAYKPEKKNIKNFNISFGWADFSLGKIPYGYEGDYGFEHRLNLSSVETCAGVDSLEDYENGCYLNLQMDFKTDHSISNLNFQAFDVNNASDGWILVASTQIPQIQNGYNSIRCSIPISYSQMYKLSRNNTSINFTYGKDTYDGVTYFTDMTLRCSITSEPVYGKLPMAFEGTADWRYHSLQSNEFSVLENLPTALNYLSDEIEVTIKGTPNQDVTGLIIQIGHESEDSVCCEYTIPEKFYAGVPFEKTVIVPLMKNYNPDDNPWACICYHVSYGNVSGLEISDFSMSARAIHNSGFEFYKNIWNSNIDTDYNYTHSIRASALMDNSQIKNYLNLKFNCISPEIISNLRIFVQAQASYAYRICDLKQGYNSIEVSVPINGNQLDYNADIIQIYYEEDDVNYPITLENLEIQEVDFTDYAKYTIIDPDYYKKPGFPEDSYSLENGVLSIKDSRALEHITDETNFWERTGINRDDVNSIIISEGITEIPGYSFYGCYNVTSITLPLTLTSVGQDAFLEHKCKYIKIPYNVTVLEDSSFWTESVLWSALIEFDWPSNDMTYRNISSLFTYQDKYQIIYNDGGLYNRPILTNTWSWYSNSDKTLYVNGDSRTVYSISKTNWEYNDITKIVFNSGIIDISYTAVPDTSSEISCHQLSYYLPNLTSIELPDTLTIISMGAFSDLTISEITIPSSVGTIQSLAFGNWTFSQTIYLDWPSDDTETRRIDWDSFGSAKVYYNDGVQYQ